MFLVRKVEGPIDARVGQPIIFTATEFNKPEPIDADLINWRLEVDGNVVAHEGSGRRVTFTPRDAHIGKSVIAMAYRNSPSRNVAATTFVKGASQEDELRAGLAALADEYHSFMLSPPTSMSIQEIARRAIDLRYDIDDLLDAVGPIDEDPGEGSAPTDAEEPEARDWPRLAIVVGHTANKPGASALAPISEQEYTWNRQLAELMQTAAEGLSIDTKVCFRDQVGIAGAYSAASAFQPDAIIELHFNSFSKSSAHGTETLYADTNPASAALAQIVQSEMTKVLRGGDPSRGAKKIGPGGRGYKSLSSAPDIPTVLVEPFFGSNPADCQIAQINKEAYARCLVNAVAQFTS